MGRSLHHVLPCSCHTTCIVWKLLALWVLPVVRYYSCNPLALTVMPCGIRLAAALTIMDEARPAPVGRVEVHGVRARHHQVLAFVHRAAPSCAPRVIQLRLQAQAPAVNGSIRCVGASWQGLSRRQVIGLIGVRQQPLTLPPRPASTAVRFPLTCTDEGGAARVKATARERHSVHHAAGSSHAGCARARSSRAGWWSGRGRSSASP